ncbi:Maf family protein [Thalassobacillus pellis]|uniref:Maf family protein n=1 Tax=Thalassobacillus pellis TaxID=748008 RepID=UPI0019619A29|nr:Maf family protein [Thalassobacillus pellis]MBM7554615.1 septum formation protein [Thalassobacillus pellis]
MKKLILGSGSPRRKELLELAGYTFEVKTSDIDESMHRKSDPQSIVEQLARMKSEAFTISDNEVLLTADTIVSAGGNILGKPESKEEASEMLHMLSGEVHDVHSGVSIRTNEQTYVFSQQTTVEFWKLTEDDIEQYIHTKDPYDKAGAYGIQSKGAILVKAIQGDYYNVVGLPLSRVVRELRTFEILPS